MTNHRGQGGGPPARLSDADKQDLCQYMQTKEEFWTIRRVCDLISARYAVRYSQRQVQRLLRQQGLYCYKPQPRDYRQAADASEKLYERLSAVADVLRLWGCHPNSSNNEVLNAYQYSINHQYNSPGKYKVRLDAQDDINKPGNYYEHSPIRTTSAEGVRSIQPTTFACP